MAEYKDRFPYVYNKEKDITVTKTAPDNVPDNTITTGPLPAGTYLIGVSFEANFSAHKLKPLAYQFTGDYRGNVYSDLVSDKAHSALKSRYYAFPKPVAEGTVITHGVEFFDPNDFDALEVLFCDVFVQRVA